MTEIRQIYPKISNAIRGRNIDELRELFSTFPDMIDYQTKFMGSWLHIAAKESSVEVVEFLIDLGLDLNIESPRDKSKAIVGAAANGNLEIVSYLISKAADIDTDSIDANPLISAIYGRNERVVREVLNTGIDAALCYELNNETKMTAMAYAVEQGSIDLAYLVANQIASGEKDKINQLIADAKKQAEINNR